MNSRTICSVFDPPRSETAFITIIRPWDRLLYNFKASLIANPPESHAYVPLP
jgi:hypothetical protein